MTNETVSTAESAVPEQTTAPTTTAGAVLRGYRTDLGLNIEVLAAAMHVPVAKLQALEDDRLDVLPDAVFARALALAACRQLKTDPAPVLALLPSQDVSRIAPKSERGIDSPLHRPSFLPESSFLAVQSWFTPMRLAALAVLALALFIAAGPEFELNLSSEDTNISKTAVEPVVPSAPVLTTVEAPVDVASVPAEMPVVTGKMVITPVQSAAIAAPAITPAVTPAVAASATGGVHAR